MVLADFSGDFLNYDNSNDGDICEIVNEGAVEFNESLKKDMFNIQVKVNDRVKTWSPNNRSGQALQKAFGMDTKSWIGQKFQIVHIDKKLLIRPITTIKM
jgi:hypothetical protein